MYERRHVFVSILGHNIGFLSFGFISGLTASFLNLPVGMLLCVVFCFLVVLCICVYIRFFSWLSFLFILSGSFFGFVCYQSRDYAYGQRVSWYALAPADVLATITDKVPVNDRLSKLTLHVLHVRRDKTSSWQKAHDYLLLYRPTRFCGQVDDRVYIKKLQCVTISAQDVRLRLMSKGLSGISYLVKKVKLLHRPSFSLARWWHQKKYMLQQAVRDALSPTSYALFAPMFLGCKVYDQMIHGLFQRWGLSYYLVRSGIHLLLIFFLFTWFLRVLRVPFRIRSLILIFVLCAYAALTWCSIPFVRAVWALVGMQVCHLMRVTVQPIQLLNLIFLICVFAVPHIFLCLDFQLTFGLTYALIFLFVD